MKWSRSILVFVLAAAVSSISAGAASAAGVPEDIAAQLAHAASAAGVQIRPEQTVTFSTQGATVTATTVQGYEQVPATDLAKGVNAGFLYLDAPGSGIDTGFYTVRASAKAGDVKVGDFTGTVQLIDATGRVAAELPAQMDAFSLTVPSDLPFPSTTIGLRARPRWNENYILIDYWCPNGSHFVFVVFFDPYWP